MFNQFKVGEIAIIQNARTYPILNGEEAEIVGPRGIYKLNNGSEMDGYPVKVLNAHFLPINPKTGQPFEKIIAAPDQLRKKRPPEQDMSWAVSKVQQIINNIPATIS